MELKSESNSASKIGQNPPAPRQMGNPPELEGPQAQNVSESASVSENSDVSESMNVSESSNVSESMNVSESSDVSESTSLSESTDISKEKSEKSSFLRKVFRFIWHIPRNLAIFLVIIYQHTLHYVIGLQCRFHPTCSQYYILAVKKYGFVYGTLKGMWRILRCNPFCRGGEDYP